MGLGHISLRRLEAVVRGKRLTVVLALVVVALFLVDLQVSLGVDDLAVAGRNARQAREAFLRSREAMHAWLARLDPVTGLLPRRGDQPTWYVRDSAADLYPFMVMAAFFTEPGLYQGAMRDILRREILFSNRVGRLPDNVLAGGGFEHPEIDLDRIIFGASEYAKDGLLPLTELLGRTAWYYRMIGLVDDIIKFAPYETRHGRLPANNAEVNGEMLQTLSRLYYSTRNKLYLKQALAIADFYFLDVIPRSNYFPVHKWDVSGDRPALDFFRLSDHGNEIVGGLSELLLMLKMTGHERWKTYIEPYRRMIDNLLEKGRNEDGVWFMSVDINTGKPRRRHPVHCWGYMYNAVYTAYLITGDERYRREVVKVLDTLARKPRYLFDETGAGMNWGADAYSDAFESAIVFLNRISNPATAAAVDEAMDKYWKRQGLDGIIEDWYGDGNYIRTALMYALMKTQGTYLEPWNRYLLLGAVADSSRLLVHVSSPVSWQGRIYFDHPRHRDNFNMPVNYPRLNEFPEWFVCEPDVVYRVKITRKDGQEVVKNLIGADLIGGLPLALCPADTLYLEVSRPGER